VTSVAVELVCQGCGRSFVPLRRSDAKTCSNACRQAAWRQRTDGAEAAALELRVEKALHLRRRGELDALDALCVVVDPSPELRAMTRQAVAA
jgi:hypothetical protein